MGAVHPTPSVIKKKKQQQKKRDKWVFGVLRIYRFQFTIETTQNHMILLPKAKYGMFGSDAFDFPAFVAF